MAHKTPTLPLRRTALVASVIALTMVLPVGSAAFAEGAVQAGCPSWSADGSGLVYCSGSDGFAEIWEMAADGSVRQITYLGGLASSPNVSPDGSLVVFQAAFGADKDPQVYVIPRDGRRGRTVMVGYSVVEIEGERAAQLTTEGSNYDPAFSSAGDRIGFTSDRLGVPSLWSMDVDGSDQRELLIATAGN